MLVRAKLIRSAVLGVGLVAGLGWTVVPAAAAVPPSACSGAAGAVQACVEQVGGSVSPSAFQRAPLPADCRIRVLLTGPEGAVAGTPWQACFAGLTRGPAVPARAGKWVASVVVRSGSMPFARASAEIRVG